MVGPLVSVMHDGSRMCRNWLLAFAFVGLACARGDDPLTIDTTECGSQQFACGGGECVERFVVCNGFENCSDGSDERDCVDVCVDDSFQCADGHCIPREGLCNGAFDCAGREDEDGCAGGSCAANEYRCDDGTCLDSRVRCDGATDCAGGEDEDSCGPAACAADEMR